MSDSNHKWFADRIADRNLTQRGLAKLLGMDPSSLSLLLHGKRRMRVEQAAEIARFLNVPVEAVMRHGGAKIEAADGIHRLSLVGWINSAGTVAMEWPKEPSLVEFDGASLPPTAVALQWRTPAEVHDGWLAAILPPRDVDESQMLDRLCVVGLASGETLLRKVRRGYTKGRYTLLAAGADAAHDAEIAWFSPVLLIRPI